MRENNWNTVYPYIENNSRSDLADGITIIRYRDMKHAYN